MSKIAKLIGTDILEPLILEGDCMDLIKDQPDNSVDLVITSPPYSDIINYGKEVSIKKPEEYVDWLLPLFKEIYRVLKPSGSFILNINDNCSKGLRNPYIYELIYRNDKTTKLKLFDTYIWHKRNGIPNGSKKRFRNMTEFIYHFVKDQRHYKFYMDRVMEEPAQGYYDRLKYPDSIGAQGKVVNGERVDVVESSAIGRNITDLPDKVRPDNVFRFKTAGASRDNFIKHPAPFNRELPEYFIKLLTDEGDIVLDPFAGIGTTGLPCIETGRKFIGYELNPKYVDYSIQRLGDNNLDKNMVCQYDLDDNLIACYENRGQASKETGVNEGDIMRTYNRTKFKTRGGYKWTLEPYDKTKIKTQK